jgi:hypothetical protein
MSNGELEAQFNSLASKWQTAESKLDSLHPPAAASADFAALKSSAANVKSDLDSIVSAARSGDVTAAKQATSKLVTDITAARSAAQKVDSEVGISG